jgi:hypothetical protein
MIYTGLQIKNEWLGTLGDAYSPQAAMTVNLDKAVFSSYAELLLLYDPSASQGTAFNLLWRYFAQMRMALITDGPGSARAENAQMAFLEFEKLTTTEKNADRFLDSSKFIYPPWMGLLTVQTGDIVVPTASVDSQPLAVAYQNQGSQGVTGAAEPTWAAPFQGSGTAAQAGGFVFAGYWNSRSMYVTVVAGTPWWLWYDSLNNVMTISLVPGTAGAEHWVCNAGGTTITGAYTYTGAITPTPTLSLAAGGSTITDGGVTWTAITFP